MAGKLQKKEIAKNGENVFAEASPGPLCLRRSLKSPDPGLGPEPVALRKFPFFGAKFRQLTRFTTRLDSGL